MTETLLIIIHIQALVHCLDPYGEQFEVVDEGEEEADEAEGNDPLAHCTGQMEGIILVVLVSMQLSLFYEEGTDDGGEQSQAGQDGDGHPGPTHSHGGAEGVGVEGDDGLQDGVGDA